MSRRQRSERRIRECHECGHDLTDLDLDELGQITMCEDDREYTFEHCPRCGAVLVEVEEAAVL